MKKAATLSVIVVFVIAVLAQTVGPGYVIYTTATPSGSCSAGSQAQVIIGAGTIYTCQSGTWTLVAGGGGASFSGLTGGTNTSAAMVVGSGASLATTGTGTIAASSVGAILSSVSFSATPTFSGANGDTFKITLTGDVTSSTFSNGVNGHTYTFIVCQDSTGGRAFVPPTSMKEYTTWTTQASQCTTQQFAYDGTNLNALAPWNIDIRPFTANAMDDEFDGNALNTSSKWTWVNQGTSTAAVGNGILQFDPAQGVNAFAVRFIEQTAPATPWTVTDKTTVFNTGGNVNQRIGMCISDGTKLVMGDYNGGSAANVSLEVATYATTTSTPTVVITSTNNSSYASGMTLYMRWQDDGTNVKFSYGYDGSQFYPLYTALRGAFLTTGPTQVGICGDGTSTAASTILLYQDVDYFRRTQ